jgi:acyl carrier protein
MTVMEKLNQVFQVVFDDDSIQISPELTANEVDGWDSLSHVNLITTIEAKFNIMFSQKELLNHRNIGNLVADIERKLA